MNNLDNVQFKLMNSFENAAMCFIIQKCCCALKSQEFPNCHFTNVQVAFTHGWNE